MKSNKPTSHHFPSDKQIDKNFKARANSEAIRMADHFSYYLKPQIAYNPNLRTNSYAIRHNVYCEELSFEQRRSSKIETDIFDTHSIHSLIQHRDGQFAGTVRMVLSLEEDQKLPLEKISNLNLKGAKICPGQFARHSICELSRLAVPKIFRRRRTDAVSGAATGAFQTEYYSETELRCFPFIAIGLYLTAASMCIISGIEHVFVMMEPRLARSMNFIGIKFEQIAPAIEYHGRRAPYHIVPSTFLTHLSDGFSSLFLNIKNQVELDFQDLSHADDLFQQQMKTLRHRNGIPN